MRIEMFKFFALFLLFSKIFCWDVLEYENLYVSTIKKLHGTYNFRQFLIYKDQEFEGDLVERILGIDSKVVNYIETYDFEKMKSILFYFPGSTLPIMIFSASFLTEFQLYRYGKAVILITDKDFLVEARMTTSNTMVFFREELIYFDICTDLIVRKDLKSINYFDFPSSKICKIAFQYYQSNKPELKYFPLMVSLSNGNTTGSFFYYNKYFAEYINNYVAIKNVSYIKKLYSRIGDNFGEFDYPLSTEEYCIIVPTMNQISKNLYITHPFEIELWLILGISSFYIALIIKLVFKGSYIVRIQNALEFVTMAPFSKEYSYKANSFGKAILQIIVFVMLISYGFIISNIYLARMSTYLTTYVYSKQIKTIDDLLESKLEVIRIYGESYFPDLPKSIEISSKPKDFYKIFCTLSRNYSYIFWSRQWKFINECQSLLLRKNFELTDICDSKPHSFNSNDPPHLYLNYMKIFTMRVHESGLMQIWETFTQIDLKFDKQFKYLRDNEDVREPLSLLYFLICWRILIIGCIFSSICFLFELFYYANLINDLKIKNIEKYNRNNNV